MLQVPRQCCALPGATTGGARGDRFWSLLAPYLGDHVMQGLTWGQPRAGQAHSPRSQFLVKEEGLRPDVCRGLVISGLRGLEESPLPRGEGTQPDASTLPTGNTCRKRGPLSNSPTPPLSAPSTKNVTECFSEELLVASNHTELTAH